MELGDKILSKDASVREQRMLLETRVKDNPVCKQLMKYKPRNWNARYTIQMVENYFINAHPVNFIHVIQY